MTRLILSLVVLLSAVSLAGCQRAYMATAERFGYAKREMLVDRVQDARDQQEEAREQFSSALDEFLALTGADGGDLEVTYNKLKKELSRSEKKADAVRGKIDGIEVVAEALFREWERELEEFSSESLRASSQDQLNRTRGRYGELIGVMRSAEQKMEPVLVAFRDQVLFLKHNLNARAIASLETTAGELQAEVSALIAEMDASIREATDFIDQMRSENG